MVSGKALEDGDWIMFSGRFNTLYLASKSMGATAENRPQRILMREVKYFKKYSVMSMMFYVRKNENCQLHSVWADKFWWKYCSITSPSDFAVVIHFTSNTTILFEAEFINDGNYLQKLSGVLATGTNVTKEMWDEYLKLNEYLNIPTENIENVYET
ncbi:probasin-like, partial [Mus pahari]|uniref:probasin-like n=1 Tax=Mus pahari TaxID=10093 RepID=UPI000A30F28D